jgi:hypothetical protein
MTNGQALMEELTRRQLPLVRLGEDGAVPIRLVVSLDTTDTTAIVDAALRTNAALSELLPLGGWAGAADAGEAPA